MKYAHVFDDEESYDLKGIELIEHQIVLENTRPKRGAKYRVPYALKMKWKVRWNNSGKRRNSGQ